MHEEAVLLLFLYGIPSLLHVVGFYLLYKTKYHLIFNKVQRYYLLNLSFVEFFISLFCLLTNGFREYIASDCIIYMEYISFGGFVLMLFFIYFVITIDRFLMVYLNIRYSRLVTYKRIRLIFGLFYMFTILSTVIIFVLDRRSLFLSEMTVYVSVPLCIIFVLCAIATYSYFGVTSKRRLKEVLRGTGMKQPKHIKMLPSLLIVSFIVFFLVPCLVQIDYIIAKTPFPRWLHLSLNVCYATGYSMDAVLYIFSLKKVRNKLSFLKRTPPLPKMKENIHFISTNVVITQEEGANNLYTVSLKVDVTSY